jgi:hypothetical protein
MSIVAAAAASDAMVIPGAAGNDSRPSSSAKAEDPRLSFVHQQSRGWSASADHDEVRLDRSICSAVGISRARR